MPVPETFPSSLPYPQPNIDIQLTKVFENSHFQIDLTVIFLALALLMSPLCVDGNAGGVYFAVHMVC